MEVLKMLSLVVSKINLKQILYSKLFMSVILWNAIVFFVFCNESIKSMNYVLNLYLPIFAIILFPIVFYLEENFNVKSVILVKKFSYKKILFIRLIIVSIVSFFIILGVEFYYEYVNLKFDFLDVFLTSFSITFIVGALSAFVYSITNNIKFSTLISFVYYYFELFTKGEYTKDFYLFSDFMLLNEKNFLMLSSFILIIVSVFLFEKNKKM
jgi:hypothetical protein